RLADAPLDRKALEREPREDRHRDGDEEHEIGEVRQELDAGRYGDAEEDEPQNREAPGPHELGPERRGGARLDRNAREDLGDNGRRREILEPGLRLKDEPVRERR